MDYMDPTLFGVIAVLVIALVVLRYQGTKNRRR
jgi:hypothetical protein